MKKVISVFLAVLMLLAIVPTAFAANNIPVITTTADKSSVTAGDIVTVTVKVSANSKLCAFTYSLKYNTSEFQVVSNSVATHGTFPSELTNANISGEVKYIGATSGAVTKEGNLFTVKLKALKSNGKLICNITEAYIDDGNDGEIDITTQVVNASTKSITFEASPSTPPATTNYFSIKTPSETTIKYKDGIVLYATVHKTLPAGSKIVWTTNNDNFITEASADGKSFTIISNNNGETTVTATLYSSSGAVLDKETIVMKSDAGFFQKIVGFFRSLFGLDKILDIIK